MVPRLAGLCALLFAATFVQAQSAKKVRIEFEGEGQRTVWIQEKGKEHTVPEHQTVSGKAVELDVPEQTKDKSVYVCDTKTGDVAARPLDQVVKAGSWAVKASDAAYAYRVAFSVQHGGKPVATAVLHMRAGGEALEALLTAADNGTASFFVVPFGDVEVTADYKSAGAEKSLSAQTFSVKSGMESANPLALTIEDEVETVAPPAKAEPKTELKGDDKGGKPQEPAPRTNGALTLVNILIGLLVIGGISYAVWRYVQANPDQVAGALKKAGVHVPGDPQDPAAALKKPAGPPKQIILDNSAPTPSDSGPVAMPGAPVVKNPRLVKADGSLYIVMDGEQTVGREPDRQLALAGESSVSRTHAKLVRTGDSVTLEDAGSTNGTFVNGHRIAGPTALSPGDTVQFGAVQYRYEE